MLLAEYDKLTRLGVLASYASVEVTEVVAFPPGRGPVNLLTVAVCEELPADEPSTGPEWIGERIRIHGAKDWTFGVARYRRTMPDFRTALASLSRDGLWQASGKALSVGDLVCQPAMFVPANGLTDVSINAVLKNNFYNGSYVLELADARKTALAPLLGQPELLKALAQSVADRSGLEVDAVSDRFGNVLIQFPVECVTLAWAKVEEGVGVSVDWRPGVPPRPLSISCSIEGDGVLIGFASTRIIEGTAGLNVGHHRRPHQLTVWDETASLLLASTGIQSFISEITSTMTMSDGQRRIQGVDGETTIVLESHSESMVVGRKAPDPNGEWEGRRLYRAGSARLAASREFVAYGAGLETADQSRQRAVADLRWLIDRHGRSGAWLWDPYLSSADLLDTLCRCRHGAAILRALTEGKRPPQPAEALEREADQTAMEAWIADQRRALDAGLVAPGALHLEYRISRGRGSWRFHDRFLIFPQEGRAALAWSLGASVNHAGAAHHILQKVPDGQRIADDFARLWDGLEEPEQLIWKNT